MPSPVLPPGLTDALSAPMGELIASVGAGVAQAQRQMDAATLQALREIATSDDQLIALMRAIGYKPTWYHIPEAEAELAIALTVSGSEETNGRPQVYAAPVDATYSSKFNWHLEASSRLRFKIVPVPAPTMAEALVIVPGVVGQTVADARAALAAAGATATLPAGAADTWIVTAQTPAAQEFSTTGLVALSASAPRKAPGRTVPTTAATLSATPVERADGG